jgi:hypothetical protein
LRSRPSGRFSVPCEPSSPPASGALYPKLRDRIRVITMPILAIEAPSSAITTRRCADPRDHDAAIFAVTMARYAQDLLTRR